MKQLVDRAAERRLEAETDQDYERAWDLLRKYMALYASRLQRFRSKG